MKKEQVDKVVNVFHQLINIPNFQDLDITTQTIIFQKIIDVLHLHFDETEKEIFEALVNPDFKKNLEAGWKPGTFEKKLFDIKEKLFSILKTEGFLNVSYKEEDTVIPLKILSEKE